MAMTPTPGFTSSEQVEACLERIRTIDAPGTGVALRSVLAVDPSALEVAAARDAERAAGAVRGPLHGVPVLVKDNIEAVGLPGTAGSLALTGRPITGDAPLVERLRAAGAVVVGATNLSEWANIRSSNSSSGWSAVGGLTANPWALDRSPGGSSSGSGAAVAAAISRFAVGTETDGSIVCPASLNGVVGIKPTLGSVPTRGVVPIAHSQDVPGPLAATVDDAEVLLSVLAAQPDLPQRSAAVDPTALRVGVVDAWLTGHARTDTLFASLVPQIERLVGAMSSAAVPATPESVYGDEYTVLMHELRDDLDAYLAERPGNGPRSLAEVIAFNSANAEAELTLFGQELFELAVGTGGCAADDYRAARARALEWTSTACFGPAFAAHDVLIAPCYAPAWKTDFSFGHRPAGGKVTSPAAIAGLPILSIPMGLVDDLPVGLAMVGPAGGEHVLIALARVVERQLGLAGDPGWAPRFSQPSRG